MLIVVLVFRIISVWISGRKASQRLIRAAVAEEVYTAKKEGHGALLFGIGNGKGKLDLDGEGCPEPTVSEDQVPTLVLK